MKTAWHAQTTAEVGRELATDLGAGLSESEAAQRLAHDGPNELGEGENASRLRLLGSQFADPLTAILLVAVVVSTVIGEYLDAFAIVAILLINGALGFAQEWRADRAIDELQDMFVARAHVRRGGALLEIPAREVVRGDVVSLEPGDRIPADLRVVHTVGTVLVDESALTGESTAAAKHSDPVAADALLADRTSLAHAGTDVISGRADGVVVAAGPDTEFGSIAELTMAAGTTEIPLQKNLADLGRRVGVGAVLIAVMTVIIGLLAGRPAVEMLEMGVSLAVAIVPEGLPAVVTVTLALGIRSMARRNALLRHLEAAETLGSASVICTDKTGTLTQNQMTVRRIWTADGFYEVPVDSSPIVRPPEAGHALAGLLESGLLCNHAEFRDAQDSGDADPVVIGDPTEAALLVLASRFGLDPANRLPLIDEIPFDSDRKLMAVLVRRRRSPDGSTEAHVKGAPEVVLERSTRILRSGTVVELTGVERKAIVEAQQSLASSGLRTLALARRERIEPGDDYSAGLTYLGFVGMHDPPRPEVPEAVARAHSAGLTVVVITGDAGATALAIANEIGIPATGILTGADLDRLPDAELASLLDGSHVLARVTPAHKMRVVDLLQRGGAVVAMTGDGVNDAPALTQASIGIAMGKRGTDVARGAADLVLVDDNFASIVAAIEEGRRQYANIRKFVRYLLSSNLGEVIAISGSVALGWPLVLVPVQILWINLLTDGVTALALGVEIVEPDAMERPPRDPDESIIGRFGMLWILVCGTLIGLASLAAFRWTLGSGTGSDLVHAQSVAFTFMVLLETVNVFNFRTERQSIVAMGFGSNRWLLLAGAFVVATQVAAVHLPGLSDALGTSGLTWREWLVLATLSGSILVLGESVKAVMAKVAPRS